MTCGVWESQPKQKTDIPRDMPVSSSFANRTSPDLAVTGRDILAIPLILFTPSAT